MARQADALDELTPREREVLEHLRVGLTDAEIAQRLEISTAGASYHVSEIIGKLGVRNRYEAAAWPERPPWWASALAPVALLWRKAGAMLPFRLSTAAAVLSSALLGAAFVGLAFMAFLLLRNGGDAPEEFVAGPGVSPPDALSPPADISSPVRVTPTPTPDPLPTLEPSDGVLVYLRGTDLWVASLDGGQSVPPRAITSGSIGTQFAGYVQRDEGATDLFYLRQLSEPVERAVPEVDLALYKTPLEGGVEQEVMRFQGWKPDLPVSSSAVAVSPDGRFVGYPSPDGLLLYDMNSGESTRLLENKSCDQPTGFTLDCWSYGSPEWAPGGEMLAVSRGYYEGGTTVVVDPFTSPTVVTETGMGGGSRWSPDGRYLCMREQGYTGRGPVVRYDVATGNASDTSANVALPAGEERQPSWNARECSFSEDGRLAVRFIIYDGREESTRLVILDSTLTPVTEVAPSEHFFNLVAWLPDGSGVLFNRAERGIEPISPAIYQPGGGFSRLPFEADWALGVIP